MRRTATTWTTFERGLSVRSAVALTRAGYLLPRTYAPGLPITIALPVDRVEALVQGRMDADRVVHLGNVRSFEADQELGTPLDQRSVSLRDYELSSAVLTTWRVHKAQHTAALHKAAVGSGAGGKAASVWLTINCRDDQDNAWVGEGSSEPGEVGERYSMVEQRHAMGSGGSLLLTHKARPVVVAVARGLSAGAALEDHQKRAAKQAARDLKQERKRQQCKRSCPKGTRRNRPR
jgi:hypothetical protein